MLTDAPWWMAAQTFIRWSRLNVWDRLLALVQEHGVQLGMTVLDGTRIRAHQKAAGAAKKPTLQHNETIVRHVEPSGSPDLADLVAAILPDVPKWVVADRGYPSHAFREHIWSLGARPAIPPRQNEAPVACPDWISNNRNQVERLWARLKEGRVVATRYEKTAGSFMGVLCLAAAIHWIRR